ncbi:histidine kinase [Lewinella sp. IMCC34191]|uniref:sensor histidine kinase n=1 Tax=Lewinella sp. IMCC34191 TaxID=2259172 RepID=UPI000E22C40C|nr:histidine kinase [Lewinella sp. IMCC34191]
MILRMLAFFLSVGLAAQDYGYRQYSTAAGLPDARVERVVTDSLGYLYARTPLGWVRFDGLQFSDVDLPPAYVRDDVWLSEGEMDHIRQRYLRDTPYADTEILDLTDDVHGYRWLATSDRGLLRQLPSSFVTYSVGGGVSTITQQDGTLYIGTEGRGLYRMVDGSPQPAGQGAELEGLRITSLVADTSFLYVGTAGRGVYALGRDTLFQVRQRDGLPSNWVRKLLLNHSGLTVLTIAGDLAYVTVGDTTTQVSLDALGTKDLPSIVDMVSDSSHRLIIQLADGERQVESRTIGTLVSGLPAVRQMSLRRGTQLWYTTDDRGIFYTDLGAKPFRYARIDDRLLAGAEQYSAVLAREEQREVWVGTDQGVSRLYLDQNGQPLYARQYGAAEGFPVRGDGPTVIFADDRGGVWFATESGLVRLTNDEDNYRTPPVTSLEAVTLFYDTIAPNRVTFRARENHLGFRFRAVDLTHPEKIRYRYRLSPLEPEWSPATTETSVRYAGLPGGRYTFTASASTDGGNTWGRPASYRFTIEVPLLLQPWLLITGVALISVLLTGAFYGYNRRMLRRQAVVRSDWEKQNQLLKLEQQARQLQMNPHFIFNALNGIRGLVDRREARDQLSRFATLMRGILHNSRQERITLAEEIATLENYLRMEQFCHPHPFTYSIDIPGSVNSEEVSLPPMLVQPFAENAILHGFSGLDRPAELHIAFELVGRRCRISIRDNGVGRAIAGQRQADRQPGHQSVAVGVTQERISAMGGSMTIQDGEPHGTVVTLEIPVSYEW